jgi:hypothetical protein
MLFLSSDYNVNLTLLIHSVKMVDTSNPPSCPEESSPFYVFKQGREVLFISHSHQNLLYLSLCNFKHPNGCVVYGCGFNLCLSND